MALRRSQATSGGHKTSLSLSCKSPRHLRPTQSPRLRLNQDIAEKTYGFYQKCKESTRSPEKPWSFLRRFQHFFNSLVKSFTRRSRGWRLCFTTLSGAEGPQRLKRPTKDLRDPAPPPGSRRGGGVSLVPKERSRALTSRVRPAEPP